MNKLFPILIITLANLIPIYTAQADPGIDCSNNSLISHTCPDFQPSRFVYVTNLNGGSVSSCTIDHDAKLGTCQNSGGSFVQPGGIATLILDRQLYAYVDNAYTNNVSQCKVDATTGLFSDCQPAASIPSVFITGIAFHHSAHHLYAYVTNGDLAGNIYQCSVDHTSGLFTNCAISGPTFANGPVLTVIKEFNNQSYLYVPDGNYGAPNQHVWQCRIRPDNGQLDRNCEDSGAGPIFNGPSALTFVKMGFNQFAYVSAYNGPGFYRCDVNPATGKLHHCKIVLTNVNQPNGVKSLVIDNKTYLFLANTTANTLIKCTVKFDGDLTDCNAQDPNATFNFPFDITLKPEW